MADQYMKDPVRVFVGSLDLNVSTLCQTWPLSLVFGLETLLAQCIFPNRSINTCRYMYSGELFGKADKMLAKVLLEGDGERGGDGLASKIIMFFLHHMIYLVNGLNLGISEFI